MNSIGKNFLETSIRRFRYYKNLGDKTLAVLTSEQLHYRPNEESNSIAIIIHHMSGNMLSRWTNFLTEDGEKPWRQRDEEFEMTDQTKEQVIARWEKGWSCFFDTLVSLKEDDLLSTVTIRQEPLTVIDAINRQLAHYPYHVGQMIYVAKLLTNTEWVSLSIPKGGSGTYNNSAGIKDPAKKF